jgi:hypothetical protein
MIGFDICAFRSDRPQASDGANLKDQNMAVRFAFALVMAAIAATSAAPAIAGGLDTLRVARAVRICATVTLNSRISRKVCLTEQEWLNNGVRLPTHIPSV